MENSTNTKGADYARKAIAFILANPNRTAREAMLRAAVRVGNYDAAGKAEFQRYL